MGDLTKNFSYKEFACRCGCGLGIVDTELVKTLQSLRDSYHKAITITSGLRCPEHNRNAGGKITSSHLKGLAVDIACSSSADRYMLLSKLVVYFNRIGIAKNFIHVDIDTEKSAGVIWTYPYKEEK